MAGCFVVHSVGFGEPFMNRHVLDIVRTVKRHDPYVDLITNGTLLKGRENEIIASGLDSLIISMDGGTEEVFEHFRAGAKWHDVTMSLEVLREQKKVIGKERPEVWIEFVAMRGNLHTLPRLVELAATEWGARGVSVEPLFKTVVAGYVEFYMEQNLSTMSYEEVEESFSKAEAIARKHGLQLSGPYHTGNRRGLWEQASFKPIYNIEYPKHGEQVDGRRDFGGWTLHPRGIARVDFRIGDRMIGQAEYGQARPDIGLNMPAFPGSGHSGFIIPIVASLLEEGENRLEVIITARTGETTVIPPVPFIYKPEEGGKRSAAPLLSERICLDTPVPATPIDDPYLVTGWLVPPLPDALKIFLDNQEMGEARLGLVRPDVRDKAKAGQVSHPDLEGCGFCFLLKLDGYREGPYMLRFESVKEGREPEEISHLPIILKRNAYRDEKVAASAEGRIDFPEDGAVVSGFQAFHGWAVYGPNTLKIRLLCDGMEIEGFCHDFAREGLRDRFGEGVISDRLGFGLMVEAAGLPRGEHAFSLCAYSRDGSLKVLHEIRCTVDHSSSSSVSGKPASESDTAVCTIRKECIPPKEPDSLLYKDPTKATCFDPYCTLPWTTTYITFDGIVRACCFSESASVLGDLKRQTFAQIWNGDAYQQLRREILEGLTPESCRACVANVRIHGRAIFDKFKEFI